MLKLRFDWYISRANSLLNAKIFSCCAFSTRHTRFAYLHWIWSQQTSLASKCVYNVSCWNEWLFLRYYNPERVCCFHLRDFNRPLKTETNANREKMFFLYDARLTCKSFNLLSVILSLSAEIICKWTEYHFVTYFEIFHSELLSCLVVKLFLTLFKLSLLPVKI